MKPHSGFVAIIGRPNVGKSTLLNRLIGEKIAGVSPKPQMTRDVIRGILTQKEGQVVFLDTPGLHDPRDLLGSHMVRAAQKTLEEADLIYFMVLPQSPHPFEEKILAMLHRVNRPAILLVNQVDRFPKPAVLPVLDHYQKAYAFRELIPISAKEGTQLDVLLQATFALLPEHPPLFPEDQISDQNERFLITEIIREKIYQQTGQEVPYAAAVIIESFEERSEKLIAIRAVVVVERESQKAIMVGKKGEKMRTIGQAARLDMEKFLGKKVFLELWVKVASNWKKDKTELGRLGYGS